jgi:hypothetical protein
MITVPGKTKYQLDKMLAHGLAYGAGTRAVHGLHSDDQLDPLFHPQGSGFYAQAKNRSTRGPYETKIATTYRRAIEKLTTEETYWANAFRDEMNAKVDFYAKAPPERRRWLEKHYTALAKEDSKRSERAARVVVHRTMHALEGEPAWVEPTYPHLDALSKQYASTAGRIASDQIAAYRYLYENLSKDKP